MMGRRGFLGRLLMSPVMATAATQAASGSVGPIAGAGISGEITSSVPFDANWKTDSALVEKLRRNLWKKARLDQPTRYPAHIESKKSWSATFKESEARKEAEKITDIQRALDDAMHHTTSPAERALALHKLVKVVEAL